MHDASDPTVWGRAGYLASGTVASGGVQGVRSPLRYGQRAFMYDASDPKVSAAATMSSAMPALVAVLTSPVPPFATASSTVSDAICGAEQAPQHAV